MEDGAGETAVIPPTPPVPGPPPEILDDVIRNEDDEVVEGVRKERLEDWRAQLWAVGKTPAVHPVFLALEPTLKELALLGARQRLLEVEEERRHLLELVQLLRAKEAPRERAARKAPKVKWTRAMRKAASERMRKAASERMRKLHKEGKLKP